MRFHVSDSSISILAHKIRYTVFRLLLARRICNCYLKALPFSQFLDIPAMKWYNLDKNYCKNFIKYCVTNFQQNALTNRSGQEVSAVKHKSEDLYEQHARRYTDTYTSLPGIRILLRS